MNFTSIEQSKKLIGLGIDKYTCDLIHRKRDCGDGYIVIVPRTDDGLLHNLNYFDERPDDIPCWSTGALINLLPQDIVVNGFGHCDLQFRKLSARYIAVKNNNIIEVFVSCGSSLLNSIIVLIEWLKENKYL